MISGLLAPSTANFIQRPNLLYKPKAPPAPGDEQQQQQQQQQQQRNGRHERSAALERAYVHDFYENNCDETSTTVQLQPRIVQFLSNLEVGSLVCDVGCGNGRYLNACNPFVFSVGVDRCVRLAKEASARGEVTVCDNLELPFRNESFDAVLSLAVIHHFATTERRINALRELSRILRIGGRVVITVWALEQKHRRFESQDVLIPTTSTLSLRNNRNTSDDEEDDEYLPPYHAYTEESTNSSRSAGDGDSSSLSSSSPGESCYSFVRKTIQKLAGGRRHPWFLDSWNSRETKNDNSLDFEDAKDLPIELRRLDDFEDLPEPPLSANLKSRSLSSILIPPPQTIVRSLSSVPSLAAPDSVLGKSYLTNGEQMHRQGEENALPAASTEYNHKASRPKLVKQKQSLCDEKSFVGVDDEAPRVLLRKQSSLNEEYLSEGRQRIRKRIHKQMSLNETFLYRSVFSKRLQVIREGLTKTSSESMERLKKTGIGRLIQKMSPQPPSKSCQTSDTKERSNGVRTEGPAAGPTNSNEATQVQEELDEHGKPRRRSRESGSDSSKDSLQSDTSIESEDSSFASVIYIPRPEAEASMAPPAAALNSNAFYPNAATHCSYSRTPTVPTSPLPCPTPAQSPAPLKNNSPLCSLTAENQHAKQEHAMNKRFTFDFEIPDNTTENLLNRNTSPFIDSLEPKIDQKLPLAASNASDCAVPPPSRKPNSNNLSTSLAAKKKFEIPPIPKFSGPKKMASFPILRRSAATPVIPKLISLEIYNPETDDSDSSEPSSPDSIDSVINALEGCGAKNKEGTSTEEKEVDEESDPVIETPERRAEPKDQPSLEEFAKQLNAQLIKELNENKFWEDLEKEPGMQDEPEVELTSAEKKQRSSLRDELRNRRLMLANLSQNGSKRFSQFSSQMMDGSDLTIHEEEDDVAEGKEGEEEGEFSAICDTIPEPKLEQQRNVGNSCPVEPVQAVVVAKKHVDEDQIPLIESEGTGTNYRHSQSSLSLESPGGGSVTHHRYYHVFREGELDALINHHVTDLHITSSHYDRSMWCIVAEKVQVWTI